MRAMGHFPLTGMAQAPAPLPTKQEAQEAFAAYDDKQVSVGEQIAPVEMASRSANPLRPSTFGDMVGQERLKSLLMRVVINALEAGKALDHMLLVGSAGTGKTTTAMVMAHEMMRDVYMLKAPVSFDTLRALGIQCKDGDVIIIDEIHLISVGDRRGVTQSADSETFYSIMEDKRLQLPTGVMPFPDVTFIGCTTDAGLLPEPFLARFPLQPHLDRYTEADMVRLAYQNGLSLDINVSVDAAMWFARACKGVPRVINRFVRNAQSLGMNPVTGNDAKEIIEQLNSTTLDGLDADQQNMLRFLLKSRRTYRNGEVRYQSGVSSIATACGKSRDQKAIALYVEPYLIERGFVAITHGGRALTDLGRERAEQL